MDGDEEEPARYHLVKMRTEFSISGETWAQIILDKKPEAKGNC